jgi:hypothetical protein
LSDKLRAEVNCRIFRCVESRAGRREAYARVARCLTHAWQCGGISVVMMEILRRPFCIGKWRDYSPERAAQVFRGDTAGLRHLDGDQTILSPARSRSGLAQQQATRRFLASIDRVRGAAIQAR